MGHERWHVNKIPGTGFGHELESLAPAHPGPSLDDVDDALKRSMVVRAGLGVRMDMHRAGPEFLRADARKRNGGLAIHAGRLRRMWGQLVAAHHGHTVVFPALLRIAVHRGLLGASPCYAPAARSSNWRSSHGGLWH